MFRQIDLRSDDHRLTAWVREQPGLKVGALITLVGDERTWEVLRLSTLRLDAPPESRWRVGGLL